MFHIPENKLPNCLKDEQRINVLFAPLRNRSVNPKDWESKLLSWKSIIKVYCETNDIYTFSLSHLNEVFVRNGRPPNYLNEVISDMVNNGEIQLVDVFLKKNTDTWSGWAMDILVKRPLTWSLNKVKDKLFTSTDHMFAHLEIIQNKCNSMLDIIPEKIKNKLISLRQLLTLLNKDSSQVNNVKLLLHHLQNQKKVDITHLDMKNNEELDCLLIKFGDGTKVLPITEIDIGSYTLEQNEINLSKNVESLEDEIQTCIQEAKMQLSKNHRQLAKSALRKKHELEKRVLKKMNALHNIQILLAQIHETHNDAHVWKAYKDALAAFDTSFKDTGISESAIEDTMIKLGDVLDEHNDIQEALGRPTHDDINDSDLEEELAELLNSDSTAPPPDDGGVNTSDLEKDMEKVSLNLPEIPDSSPNASTQEVLSV